jgi:hypothetical protein
MEHGSAGGNDWPAGCPLLFAFYEDIGFWETRLLGNSPAIVLLNESWCALSLIKKKKYFRTK